MSLVDRIAKIGPAFKRVNDALLKNTIEPWARRGGGVLGTVTGAVAGKAIDLVNAARKVDYKSIGKAGLEKGKRGLGYTLADLTDEAEKIGRSGSLLRKQLLGDAPITTNYFGPDSKITKLAKKTALFRRDDSSIILGAKATPLGIGVIGAGMLVAGSGKATKNYMQSLRGTNDGTLRSNAPINTYAQGQQVSSHQIGHSYANNAGATGDLVFALHNQRKTGIY